MAEKKKRNKEEKELIEAFKRGKAVKVQRPKTNEIEKLKEEIAKLREDNAYLRGQRDAHNCGCYYSKRYPWTVTYGSATTTPISPTSATLS